MRKYDSSFRPWVMWDPSISMIVFCLFCLNGPQILDPVVGRPRSPGFSLKPKGLACL